MLEILSEEETKQLIESMSSPFRKESSCYPCSATRQNALLIYGPGQDYQLTRDHDIPEPHEDEILIRVVAIGLNPVDWKGPEYNFGLPSLPWVNGRDLAGIVIKAPKALPRIRVGDIVLSPSTGYRDIRKAAFQEYVISTEHTCARIPERVPPQTAAAVGVAFVAAALALGMCLGVDFSQAAIKGPDLLSLVRVFRPSTFPEDIRYECTDGIRLGDRARRGEWIAIWGGRSYFPPVGLVLTEIASTTTGYVAIQLAKLAGLKTIAVADIAKHGAGLQEAGADILVDRLDTDRAVSVIRGVTRGGLRFGIDTVGCDTATLLQSSLSTSTEQGSHLVGLTGLPKSASPNVIHHNVPIKAFHAFPRVGEALMQWLEALLLSDVFRSPRVHLAHGGFEAINPALLSLKDGRIDGNRIVVPMSQPVASLA